MVLTVFCEKHAKTQQNQYKTPWQANTYEVLYKNIKNNKTNFQKVFENPGYQTMSMTNWFCLHFFSALRNNHWFYAGFQLFVVKNMHKSKQPEKHTTMAHTN